ncbi:HNH endonuclease [Aneurinibacillus aneurinilyticus]|uniref:HNH endonuclease n=1 Tax=Aneurinibacillus aneurinilyticus TaxID=1391 RepID=UPI0035253B8B
MSFSPGISQGDIISNQELCNIFGCSPQGGMRRSHATNTLVIISNHVESLYEDRWIDNTLHYTGMGRTGDQVLQGNQNITLYESRTNGVGVHLFEVYRDKEYIYTGPVELADEPYQEIQLDEQLQSRLVWMFPLRLKSGYVPLQIDIELLENKVREQEKRTRRLSDEEIRQRALEASNRQSRNRRQVNKRPSIRTKYDRNTYVAEYAKRWANGICQLKDHPAPFNDRKGQPFLESHHIEWLSRGGADSITNTVALCPNCHTEMHERDRKSDVERLKRKVQEHLESIDYNASIE